MLHVTPRFVSRSLVQIAVVLTLLVLGPRSAFGQNRTAQEEVAQPDPLQGLDDLIRE